MNWWRRLTELLSRRVREAGEWRDVAHLLAPDGVRRYKLGGDWREKYVNEWDGLTNPAHHWFRFLMPEDREKPREELVWSVARMLNDWETSDELAGEFARRLIEHILAAQPPQTPGKSPA